MFKTLRDAFKERDIRKSILITILLLLVFRLGCFLPVPGIIPDAYASRLSGTGILSLLNGISGSALSQGGFLALTIVPYINASIVVQLLVVAIPPLQRRVKDGDDGQKFMAKITKWLALFLAVVQALGLVFTFGTSALNTNLFGMNTPTWIVGAFVVLMFVAGSCFTMWLADRITDQQIGQGSSMIIFVGIIAQAGLALINVFGKIFSGSTAAIWELSGFLLFVIVLFTVIVFINSAERKIPVHYAKQVKGRKMYGGQNSYIPLKVNASGVLPIIFATAIISFPNLIMELVGTTRESSGFARFYYDYLGAGGIIYSILVGLLILFFAFFYAEIQFNPSEVSQNIQQHGGFIPGIRPGKPTTEYLQKVSRRITLFGAIFLAFIAIVPSIIFGIVAGDSWELINAFTATGMLIVVGVAIEFQQALESRIMMKRHKNIL